jgi:hypothetical protein
MLEMFAMVDVGSLTRDRVPDLASTCIGSLIRPGLSDGFFSLAYFEPWHPTETDHDSNMNTRVRNVPHNVWQMETYQTLRENGSTCVLVVPRILLTYFFAPSVQLCTSPAQITPTHQLEA